MEAVSWRQVGRVAMVCRSFARVVAHHRCAWHRRRAQGYALPSPERKGELRALVAAKVTTGLSSEVLEALGLVGEPCFECGAPGGRRTGVLRSGGSCAWIALPWGMPLCLECTGRHYHLGVHISFVRSVSE